MSGGGRSVFVRIGEEKKGPQIEKVNDKGKLRIEEL